MKTFLLVRNEDVSGVSGTGVIAEGVEFENGKCVLGWLPLYRSVSMYDSVDEMEAVHGHNGRTYIEWIKEP